MVLFLSTSSDNVLYLDKHLSNLYLIGFQSYGPEQ